MRLHPFAELLLGLYSPEEVVVFAVLWLGPAYQPLGPWLAGNYANQISAEVERRGMLRDKVFWDALVIERPFREEAIRNVERLFAPPKLKPVLLPQPKPLLPMNPKARSVVLVPRVVADRLREDAYIRAILGQEEEFTQALVGGLARSPLTTSSLEVVKIISPD